MTRTRWSVAVPLVAALAVCASLVELARGAWTNAPTAGDNIPGPAQTTWRTHIGQTTNAHGGIVAAPTNAYTTGMALMLVGGRATWGNPTATSTGAATWGNITGTIGNQTDLAAALAGKVATNDAQYLAALQPAATNAVAGWFAPYLLTSTYAAGTTSLWAAFADYLTITVFDSVTNDLHAVDAALAGYTNTAATALQAAATNAVAGWFAPYLMTSTYAAGTTSLWAAFADYLTISTYTAYTNTQAGINAELAGYTNTTATALQAESDPVLVAWTNALAGMSATLYAPLILANMITYNAPGSTIAVDMQGFLDDAIGQPALRWPQRELIGTNGELVVATWANDVLAGNGAGLTNIPASGITEADPVWVAASGSVLYAESDPLSVAKTGGTYLASSGDTTGSRWSLESGTGTMYGGDFIIKAGSSASGVGGTLLLCGGVGGSANGPISFQIAGLPQVGVNLAGAFYGSGAALTNIPGAAVGLFAGSGTTGTVTSAGGDAGKYLRADGTWQTVSGSAPAGTLVVTNAGSAGQVATFSGGAADGVQTGYWAAASSAPVGTLVVTNAGSDCSYVTWSGGSAAGVQTGRWEKLPKAYLYCGDSGSNGIPQLEYTPVTFSTSQVARGITYNASTGDITVPYYGVYRMSFRGVIQASMTSWGQIYCSPTNDAAANRMFWVPATAGYCPMYGSSDIILNTGVVYGVYGRHNDTGTKWMMRHSLSIQLVECL